ncbi:MAG: hypothetical protein EOO11_20595 [Chitinophagaceae bacterium]|nr:MAG: hypothetical protein EOO11_20595 [Chitinophagaceae bacterium]
MTRDQLNDFERLKKVQAHFQLHTRIWTGNEPVEAPVQDLDALIVAIRRSMGIQDDPGSSDKSAAQLALDRAVYKTYILCRRACTWARRKDDAALLKEMDQSESDLGRGPRDSVLARLRRFEERLRALTGIPAVYKISDEVVDELKAAIEAVDGHHKEGSDKNSHSISATAEIELLFKRSLSVLEALDDAVEGYIGDEEFVRAYFVNRRTNDRRARQKQEDSATGA